MDAPPPFFDVFGNDVWKRIGNVNMKGPVDLYASPNLPCGKTAGIIIHRENSNIIIRQNKSSSDFSCVSSQTSDDLGRILVNQHGQLHKVTPTRSSRYWLMVTKPCLFTFLTHDHYLTAWTVRRLRSLPSTLVSFKSMWRILKPLKSL